MWNLNLYLAVFWFLLGVGMIAYHGVSDDPSWRLPIGEGGISAGWLALVLTVYNLVRWWSIRSYRASRLAAEQARKRRRVSTAPEPTERNPDFDFGDRS